MPALYCQPPTELSVECAQSCAYRNFASDLELTGLDYLIFMFRVYFDDSGTDANSDITVAACYVSTKRGWDEFVTEWDRARWQEGFDSFHMAEFTAPSEHQHKPYCDWDEVKKNHVYERLAKIINQNKRIGIAVAVPKENWNRTPERIRLHFGTEHYTFAVRLCMMQIAKWRKKSLISLPIQYVFDWEMNTSRKRKEIDTIFEIFSNPAHEHLAEVYGVEPEGYSFQRKENFKPLQAADILAWQMRSHMHKIWLHDQDDLSLCHPGFRMLREDQEMDLGFMTEEQITRFVEKVDAWEKSIGPLPPLYPQR
ncbi:MAG TPA: DUF3800 domain-containing protein [Terriglobia bacterium]|nr:DUF3800 domain-containing protein [Terriglobia bacterium]